MTANKSMKRMMTTALIALGLAATGTQAFAEDRDHYRGDRDSREYRYDRERDHRRYEREREEYREREAYRYRQEYRPYYATPYYAPAPVYVRPPRPGISLYFGIR